MMIEFKIKKRIKTECLIEKNMYVNKRQVQAHIKSE